MEMMRAGILPRVMLLVALGAVPVTACGYFGLRAYARSVLFPGSNVAFAGAAELGDARVVEYEAADGTRLAGAWVRSGREQAPTVLYFHGNGESAAHNLPLAAQLAE